MQTNHSPAGRSDSPYRVVWGPQRFYLSIGWKTLIAFALVVFIPMLGLMHITDRTLRSAMEAETLRSLEANLRGAWRVYQERINATRSALLQSAASPEVKAALSRGDQAALSHLLERHAALLPYGDVWVALDREKRVVARRNGKRGDQIFLNDLLARAYTFNETVTSTELLPNELFIEENPLKYSNLEPQVMAQVTVVPVQEKGELVGALVGLILMNNNNWLPNAIHDYLSIDAALFGSVIQESRIISASERPNNIWATGLLAPSILNDFIRKGEVYRGRLTINEIDSFIIAEPIYDLAGNPVGALSIGVRSTNIEELIAKNTQNIYLFILLGVVLSLLVAYLAHRDTMTPIRAIIGAMNEFAEGQLRVRTEIRTKDEFEELGRGFNRMAAAIQEQSERVESFNSLTSLLITSLKPQELLHKVLNKVVELTGSQSGVIYLTEMQGEERILNPYVAYAVDINSMHLLRFGEGMPGEAARQKRVVHVKHIPEDCKINVNFGLADALPKEIVVIPIIYQERVLGVMLLGTLRGFRTNEMALLEYMATQIAVVLENALTHEQVEQLSITDGLTGVWNRTHVTERMEHEFQKAQRHGHELAVLMLDVDHFKRINDGFGHQVGDLVLVGVARALKGSLRSTDLIGRYGGEEFIVMLPHTGRADAIATAEKLRKAIAALQVAVMGEQRITISIGLSALPDGGAEHLDDLIKKADDALYAAKDGGRNRVVSSS